MAEYIAKQIATRVLNENLQNQFGRQDSYFENVPATRLNQDQRTLKKGQRAKPPGVSDHDFKILTKVKRRAHFLDSSLSFCGIRFGFSSLIGLIPVVGDVIDLFCAAMVVRTCTKIEGGLPAAILFRMWLALAIDFGIGLVPFIGDVADALYKANTHNAARLENFLRERGRKELRNSGLPVPDTDPSDPAEFDRYHGAPPPKGSQQSGVMAKAPPAAAQPDVRQAKLLTNAPKSYPSNSARTYFGNSRVDEESAVPVGRGAHR